MLPKLACVCCTYARPELLCHSLQCYLMQDYPADRCELIILDDANQYVSQTHAEPKTWHLVSSPRRFRTLGEKRNACAAMASADVDAYVVWDDDDIYLPWTLQAHAAALAQAPWSRASQVLIELPDTFQLTPHTSGGLFHSAWAYTRQLFQSVQGYPFQQAGEDQGLAHHFAQSRAIHADPLMPGFEPFFVHRWDTSRSWHLSALPDRDAYENLARLQHQGPPIARIEPSWPRDYRQAKTGRSTPVWNNGDTS